MEFIKSQGFDHEKGALIFRLLHSHHAASMAAQLPVEESLQRFRRTMVEATQNQSLPRLSLEDVKAITGFLLGTFFEHYSLHLCAWHPTASTAADYAAQMVTTDDRVMSALVWQRARAAARD